MAKPVAAEDDFNPNEECDIDADEVIVETLKSEFSDFGSVTLQFWESGTGLIYIQILASKANQLN